MEKVELSIAEQTLLADRINQGRDLIEQAQVNNNNLVASGVRAILSSHAVKQEDMPVNIRDLIIRADPQGAPTSIEWEKPAAKNDKPAEIVDKTV